MIAQDLICHVPIWHIYHYKMEGHSRVSALEVLAGSRLSVRIPLESWETSQTRPLVVEVGEKKSTAVFLGFRRPVHRWLRTMGLSRSPPSRELMPARADEGQQFRGWWKIRSRHTHTRNWIDPYLEGASGVRAPAGCSCKLNCNVSERVSGVLLMMPMERRRNHCIGQIEAY